MCGGCGKAVGKARLDIWWSASSWESDGISGGGAGLMYGTAEKGVCVRDCLSYVCYLTLPYLSTLTTLVVLLEIWLLIGDVFLTSHPRCWNR